MVGGETWQGNRSSAHSGQDDQQAQAKIGVLG
jgi:hypothetical protein